MSRDPRLELAHGELAGHLEGGEAEPADLPGEGLRPGVVAAHPAREESVRIGRAGEGAAHRGRPGGVVAAAEAAVGEEPEGGARVGEERREARRQEPRALDQEEAGGGRSERPRQVLEEQVHLVLVERLELADLPRDAPGEKLGGRAPHEAPEAVVAAGLGARRVAIEEVVAGDHPQAVALAQPARDGRLAGAGRAAEPAHALELPRVEDGDHGVILTALDPRYPPLSRPAADFGPAEGSPPGPAAAALDLDGLERLEVVCPRPIHHVLEYVSLFRLAEEAAARRPGIEIRFHLRSALAADPAPFGRLPGRVVPAPAAEGADASDALAQLAKELRRPGAGGVLVGADPAAARALTAAPGARWVGSLPLDFRVGYPESAACRQASDAFFAALAAASPRWVEPAGAAPPPLAGPSPRILVHPSRSHVGDTLWATPLLRAIGRLLPGARVTVAGEAVLERVLAGSPHVEELLVFDPWAQEDRARVRRELARRRFDAALFAFARRPKSRWLAAAAAAAGVAHRVDLEYFEDAADGRRPGDLFTAQGFFFWGTVASPRMLMHALAPLLGPGEAPPGWLADRRLELRPDRASHAAAARLLEQAGVGGEPFAVLAPGGASSERWPAGRFAELAARLAGEAGLHVVVEGGPGEDALLAEVARGIEAAAGSAPGRRRVMVRRDPLGVLAALLARAALLVANDSAAIHVAETAGTPSLYFAQHEKLTHSHPAGARQLALFDDLENRVARISVDQALAASAWLLDPRGAGAPIEPTLD